MLTLFWQTLRDRRTIIVAYCVAALLFLWMYAGLYPSIREQSEELMKLTDTYPPELLKAFGVETIDFSNFGSFVAMEHFSFVWPLMALFLAISYAGGALAGEIEKGTMELLLSQPLSRVRVYFTRYLVGLKIVALFVLVSILAIVPIAELYAIEYFIQGIWLTTLLGLMFVVAVLSLSFLASAHFSERGKVYFTMGGLMILMYVLNLVAALKENLTNLQYLSFFHYFDPSRSLVKNEIDVWAYPVFLGASVLAVALGYWRFIKRDIGK